MGGLALPLRGNLSRFCAKLRALLYMIVKGMKKNSVRSFHVKHTKMEFVKKVKKGAGHILTGTQCIDRFWQSVDSYIPSSVQSKRDMTVNPRLLMYLYSYIWRSQLPKKANFAKHLGKIC